MELKVAYEDLFLEILQLFNNKVVLFIINTIDKNLYTIIFFLSQILPITKPFY